jgi:hypothetical protein
LGEVVSLVEPVKLFVSNLTVPTRLPIPTEPEVVFPVPKLAVVAFVKFTTTSRLAKWRGDPEDLHEAREAALPVERLWNRNVERALPRERADKAHPAHERSCNGA